MPDLAEGFIDWTENKLLITPALQVLVNAGVLTLGQDHTIEQAADMLTNALIELGGKKVATPPS